LILIDRIDSLVMYFIDPFFSEIIFEFIKTALFCHTQHPFGI